MLLVQVSLGHFCFGGENDCMPSMLKRSAGISLDTFRALIISSQKEEADTASPGNFMFMPMMAMGVVLSVVAMIAVFGMVLKLNGYKLCQRLVTSFPGADAPRLDNKVCGRLPEMVASTVQVWEFDTCKLDSLKRRSRSFAKYNGRLAENRFHIGHDP